MVSLFALEAVAWEAPGGRRVLSGIDLAIGPGRTGLVGRNGVGKSTLIRLLAGELEPSDGHIARQGRVAMLSQNPKLDLSATVADTLGIGPVVAAIAALEAGEFSDALYGQIGDDWDIEERARATLDALGLASIALSRPLETLSGGEATRVALGGLLLARPDLLILDEPTNHLDIVAREALYTTLMAWTRPVLVISHDRRLLELMERIVELSPAGAKTYGGGWEAYRAQKALEDEAAERRLSDAERELRRVKAAAQRTREKQARRAGRGKRGRGTGSQPKATLNKWKEVAEATSARVADQHAKRQEEASEGVKTAQEQVERSGSIRLDLSGTTVPSGRLVLELEGVQHRFADSAFTLGPLDLRIVGPERLALTGPNGSGKTTLVQIICQNLKPQEGRVRIGTVRVAFLDQHTAVLDEGESLLQNMRRLNPGLDESTRRWVLHRFLFHRDTVDKPVGVLSGGERMRAAMACLLAAERPPQLLILDEPTNNLDLDAVERVQEALSGFRGALIVISHDAHFLAALGVNREIRLELPG